MAVRPSSLWQRHRKAEALWFWWTSGERLARLAQCWCDTAGKRTERDSGLHLCSAIRCDRTVHLGAGAGTRTSCRRPHLSSPKSTAAPPGCSCGLLRPEALPQQLGARLPPSIVAHIQMGASASAAAPASCSSPQPAGGAQPAAHPWLAASLTLAALAAASCYAACAAHLFRRRRAPARPRRPAAHGPPRWYHVFLGPGEMAQAAGGRGMSAHAQQEQPRGGEHALEGEWGGQHAAFADLDHADSADVPEVF